MLEAKLARALAENVQLRGQLAELRATRAQEEELRMRFDTGPAIVARPAGDGDGETARLADKYGAGFKEQTAKAQREQAARAADKYLRRPR